jgi:3-deoxy-7-phosphoheptulonate synthase
MFCVIEVLDYTEESLDMVSFYADCFQVGARQMQNYSLLKKLGKSKKTVFLKRNPGATLDEWLGSAEHLLSAGECYPVLIERGSATNANHVRWDLSISMIPAVKAISDIPIIVDGSHGTGRRDLVTPMSLAGVAAGADGMLVEVHTDPENSLSVKEQAIDPVTYQNLITKVRSLRNALY